MAALSSRRPISMARICVWGNSDGRFLYPPNRAPNENKTPNFDAPVNSIRWELLREGIEDSEYFWTLRETLARAKPKAKTAAQKSQIERAKKLLIVPPEIPRTLTNFTNSPRQCQSSAMKSPPRLNPSKKSRPNFILPPSDYPPI